MNKPFPAADLPMIAPFWANVDLTRHGETFDNNVWWAVDAGGGRLIVTWNEVGRVGSKVDLLNSFQLILSTTDDPGLGNFDVEFRYNRCEWHTGDGDSDAPVQIGFDAGDAQNYGNLGISRTEEALQVCCRSNVDNPGVWRFKMRDGIPAGASLLLHNGGEGEGDEGDEGEGAEGEGGEGEGGESEGDEGGGEGASLCDGSHEPGEIFCASANMRNQWDPECAFPFELPCDQGMVCHPPTAECVVQECNHNTSKCKDQHTRLFCNETGSAWLPPSPCAEGLVCVEVELNGFCAEVICQPGTLGCEDDETVKVCNDNGTDWVFEPCGQGQSCDEDDHACKDRICDPDATRCDDEDEQLIWVCDSVGISEEELVCPQDKRCQAGVCEFR
jgi:hypothetical protein